MEVTSAEADRKKVWDLIKNERVAMLVTETDGKMKARPMGCLQDEFDGTLWFLTSRGSPKTDEIRAHSEVLISYADPSKYGYVSVSGRARMSDDRDRIKRLWRDDLRVWFPDGPDSASIGLVAVDVESATYWTNTASFATYAWIYVRTLAGGSPARQGEIGEEKRVEFNAKR